MAKDMRQPIESGCPDGFQYMHPLMVKNFGQWRWHDHPRPGVLRHVADSGDEVWTVKAGTQRILDVFTLRKLCDIGDEFAGVVASVTRFGMFVELSDIYMEGLVHISALPSDYYHFDQASQRLVGEHTRKTYQLGDAVRVQGARVDLDDRKIDLEIVGEVTPGAGRRGNKKSVRRQSRASDAPSSKRSKSSKAADRRAPHSSRSSDKGAPDKKAAKVKGAKAKAAKGKASKVSKKASKNKGAPKRRGRS